MSGSIPTCCRDGTCPWQRPSNHSVRPCVTASSIREGQWLRQLPMRRPGACAELSKRPDRAAEADTRDRHQGQSLCAIAVGENLRSTGQRHAKRRGTALRQHLDPALVGMNDLLGDVEAEPKPVTPRSYRFRWVKRLEKVRENRGVDFAAVGHAEEDAVRPPPFDSHTYEL